MLRPSGRASNAGGSACWEITRKCTRHPCMGHPAVGTCAGGSPAAPLVGLTPLGCSGSAGCGQQDMQAAAQIPTLIAQQWRLAWGEVSHSLPGLLDDTRRQPSLPLKVSHLPIRCCPGRCTAKSQTPFPAHSFLPSALLQATMLSSSLYREAGLAGLLRNSLTTPTVSTPATSGFLASPR